MKPDKVCVKYLKEVQNGHFAKEWLAEYAERTTKYETITRR